MDKHLNKNDYQNHLKEQIVFLQSSCKSYDSGNEFEAKRMAVTVRVLVSGDNPNARSQPLLGQMHLKKKMNFISTAQPYQTNNLLTQQCLLSMQLTPNGAKYLPLFENNNQHHLLKYRNWINEIVLSDKKHNVYRRKDVIVLLANKDGGAHVDPCIEDLYSEMKSPDIGGWEFKTTDGNTSYGNDAIYATMRQITFEVLHSIYLIRPLLFKERYF